MNDDSLRGLLTAIRESCSPATWSRAVELARSHAVVGESDGEDEIRLRVTTDQGLVAPTVTFWPGDVDWWCDCESGSDQTCIHAAAAIIALRQARKAGKKLPEASQPTGKVGYRFLRAGASLAFKRTVVIGSREEKLTGTLSALALGRVDGPKVVADANDLAVERALNARPAGVVPRHELPALFEALEACDDVRLDGTQVTIGPIESPIRVVVEDCAQGYRLTAVQDSRITEVFDNGAVLRGNVLREVGEAGLTARELEEYRKGRIIDAGDVASLLSDLLPDLRRRVPVDIRTKKLPSVDRNVLPRLRIETRRDGDELMLFGTIVYGDPPVARVDGEQLTHLQGPLPIRRPEMERRLARTLESELGVSAGQRVRLPAEAGVQMAERIRCVEGAEMSVVGDGHRSFFHAGELLADLRVEGDDFGVSFQTREGQQADASSVLRGLAFRRLVGAPDGRWIRTLATRLSGPVRWGARGSARCP